MFSQGRVENSDGRLRSVIVGNGSGNGDDSGIRGRAALWNGGLGTIDHTRLMGKGVDGDVEVYGMKGLLPVVSPTADGKSETILSVGLDLTGLGLNLNSTEALHKTFNNPWVAGGGSSGGREGEGNVGGAHGGKGVGKETDFKLPTCYYMQPPNLRSSHFNKFELETLFYIFYNMPRDALQLLAATELYTRKWQYHKDLKLWFSCDVQLLQSYERGGYIYFDIKAWERRPFPDANQSFIQGFMTEDELRAVAVPTI